MENIIRDVRDIDTGDRRAIEHVVGKALRDNQRLVIQIVSLNLSEAAPSQSTASDELPDWCNVYEGLSGAEIAEIEKSIVRSHDSRSFS
ncbi:MAG TPA: hypothetical protein VIK18_22620 [Pirellulales bacterium]